MFTAIIRYPNNPDMPNEFYEASTVAEARSGALENSAVNCPRSLEIVDAAGRTASGPVNVPLGLSQLGGR